MLRRKALDGFPGERAYGWPWPVGPWCIDLCIQPGWYDAHHGQITQEAANMSNLMLHRPSSEAACQWCEKILNRIDIQFGEPGGMSLAEQMREQLCGSGTGDNGQYWAQNLEYPASTLCIAIQIGIKGCEMAWDWQGATTLFHRGKP